MLWHWRAIEQFGQKPTPLPCQKKKRKKNGEFLSSMLKGSNFIGSFCLRGKLLETKTFTGVSFCDTEGPWKVWAKTKSWFLNQHKKIGELFFPAGERAEFSNFTGFFCLKGKFLEPKNFTGVSFFYTERPWKGWEKTESWFPNQPEKNWWISLQQARRVKFSDLIGLFCLKDKLPEPKILTGVSFCDTERPWKVWRKTESWFPNHSKKIGEFLCSRREGPNFQILLVSFV